MIMYAEETVLYIGILFIIGAILFYSAFKLKSILPIILSIGIFISLIFTTSDTPILMIVFIGVVIGEVFMIIRVRGTNE